MAAAQRLPPPHRPCPGPTNPGQRRAWPRSADSATVCPCPEGDCSSCRNIRPPDPVPRQAFLQGLRIAPVATMRMSPGGSGARRPVRSCRISSPASTPGMTTATPEMRCIPDTSRGVETRASANGLKRSHGKGEIARTPSVVSAVFSGPFPSSRGEGHAFPMFHHIRRSDRTAHGAARSQDPGRSARGGFEAHERSCPGGPRRNLPGRPGHRSCEPAHRKMPALLPDSPIAPPPDLTSRRLFLMRPAAAPRPARRSPASQACHQPHATGREAMTGLWDRCGFAAAGHQNVRS
jgi:hypothetical protein